MAHIAVWRPLWWSAVIFDAIRMRPHCRFSSPLHTKSWSPIFRLNRGQASGLHSFVCQRGTTFFQNAQWSPQECTQMELPRLKGWAQKSALVHKLHLDWSYLTKYSKITYSRFTEKELTLTHSPNWEYSCGICFCIWFSNYSVFLGEVDIYVLAFFPYVELGV